MVGTWTMGAERWTLQLALARPVTSAVQAYELLEVLVGAGIPLERVDDVEPVRRPYSLATVEEIFADGHPDAPCRSLIGRGKRNQGYVLGMFCRPDPDGGSMNHLSVKTGLRSPAIAATLVDIARAFLADGRIDWACVDRDEVHYGQRPQGNNRNRLGGITWFNAYANVFVVAIGEDLLLSVPWSRTERTPQGIMTWIHDEPGVVPLDIVERRTDFRRVLGEEKFVAGQWPGMPRVGSG